VRRVRPGVATDALVVAPTSPGRSSGFPRLTRLGDQTFLAWTEVGPPTLIRTAVVDTREPAAE
jgi:hypothetical protein